MVLLRLLAWPLFVGLGFAFVVWFYELMGSSSLWREIDEVLWVSALAWFLGPALTWALIPASWGRSSFMVWTLAGGGTAVFASLLVLIASFFYSSDVWSYMEFDANDMLRLLASFGATSVEKAIWEPGMAAAYLAALSLGYAVPLGLMSLRLGLLFVAASAIGAVFAYFLYSAVGQGLGNLMVLVGWHAGLSSSLPMPFALAALVGFFGALGIAIWSLISPPIQEEASW